MQILAMASYYRRRFIHVRNQIHREPVRVQPRLLGKNKTQKKKQ